MWSGYIRNNTNIKVTKNNNNEIKCLSHIADMQPKQLKYKKYNITDYVDGVLDILYF